MRITKFLVFCILALGCTAGRAQLTTTGPLSNVTTGKNANTACGTIKGCQGFVEQPTSCISTYGKEAVYADSITHTIRACVNGAPSTVMVTGIPTWHMAQIPSIFSALGANVSGTTFYTTTSAGVYRVCVSEELTRPASGGTTPGSTLPAVGVIYTSSTDGVTRFPTVPGGSGGATDNLTYLNNTGCTGGIPVAASTNIQFQTYGCSGTTPFCTTGTGVTTTMQYNVMLYLEVLE